MGCVVNGPGEARHADLGIAAGKHKGHLFIKGKIVRVVPEDEMVEALVAEAERLVAEGIEARLAAADASAEAEAAADRAALLDERGADANHASVRIAHIRSRLEHWRSDAVRFSRCDHADVRLLLRTLRDDPADADTAGHALLVRGGLRPARGLGRLHVPAARDCGCCAARRRSSARSSTPRACRSC